MGATGSISSPTSTAYSSPNTSQKQKYGNARVLTNGKSSLKRVEASTSTKFLSLQAPDGVTYELQFCYLTQRGYYPHDGNKANQDSFLICENFMGDTQTHIFGIFDGHGETGDLCSYFTAENLPSALEAEVNSSSVGSIGVFETQEMSEMYSQAFENLNTSLHSAPIDDTLSGTTAITVVFRGNSIYG